MLMLGKVVAGILGGIFLWVAVFCFEDEEGKIQNILEKWWIQLDQSKKAAVSTETAFVQGVARLSSQFFDRIFGPRIVSSRAITVSLFLSLASLIIGYAIYEGDWEDSPGILAIVIVFGIACLVFGLLQSRWQSLWWLKIKLVVVAAFALLVWGSVVVNDSAFDKPTTFDASDWLRLFGFSLFLAITSLGCGVGFVLLTRRTLELASKARKVSQVLFAIFLNYGAIFLLVAIPWYRFISRPQFLGISYEDGSRWFYVDWNDITVAITYSNLLSGIIVSAFLAIGIVVLGHRLIWPLIERPVYTLGRLGIARRKNVLTTLAIFMLSFAFGRPLDWLSKLLDSMR